MFNAIITSDMRNYNRRAVAKGPSCFLYCKKSFHHRNPVKHYRLQTYCRDQSYFQLTSIDGRLRLHAARECSIASHLVAVCRVASNEVCSFPNDHREAALSYTQRVQTNTIHNSRIETYSNKHYSLFAK